MVAAYPSGHAAGVAAVAVSALLLFYRRWGGVAAILLAPVAGAAVIGVTLGILALRLHHYPTDALGGAMLGSALALALTATLGRNRASVSPEQHGGSLAGPPGEHSAERAGLRRLRT